VNSGTITGPAELQRRIPQLQQGARNKYMANVKRSAIVAHTPADMFRLVADVDSYPSFLPWVTDSAVHSDTGDVVEASIEFARGPVKQSLTTRNEMEKDRAIEMSLVKGPFKALHGRWDFEAVGDDGCKISLQISFDFSNKVVQGTFGTVFNQIANTLVDAFCRRANEVYK